MTERKGAFRGERLREVRVEKGLTQAQLADLTQSSKTQIIRYETGEGDPSLDLLLRLVIELSVSSDWLIGVAGASKSPTPYPVGVSRQEMELIEAVRDQDAVRIFRLMVVAFET